MGYGIELSEAETDIRIQKNRLSTADTIGSQPVKWPTSASMALAITLDSVQEALNTENREDLRKMLVMLAARASHWVEQLDNSMAL
jgi:hypothetical protein